MPIKRITVSSHGKKYGAYQWGNHGKAYRYELGDVRARKRAYEKAIRQAQAAHSHGYVEK